jgi:NAD(P)-dependent dehydrogenase (short-subunit alcohol dehydrogenase family)
VAGLRAYGNIANYVAAKHGLVGLTRPLALELAPHMIRVNSVHLTQVRTVPRFRRGPIHHRGRPAGRSRLVHPLTDFAAATSCAQRKRHSHD